MKQILKIPGIPGTAFTSVLILRFHVFILDGTSVSRLNSEAFTRLPLEQNNSSISIFPEAFPTMENYTNMPLEAVGARGGF